MPSPGRFWRGAGPKAKPFAWALGAIAAVALAVRWVLVLVVRPTCDPPLALHLLGRDLVPGDGSCFAVAGDAAYYHVQAQLLGDGHLFAHPYWFLQTGHYADSASHPPAYSTFLGLFSAVGLDSATTNRLLSGLLGVAAVVVIGLLARRLAGDRAGLLAAAAAAVYPMLWINDGMLQAESLYALVIAVMLLLAHRFWDEPTPWRMAALSVVVGVAALTRTEGAFFFVVLVLPLALRLPERDWGSRFRLLGVGALVGFLVLAPWVGFNLARFEKPVYLTNSAGSVMSDASCDSTYYGEYIGYHANCVGDDPPLELDQGDESVREARLFDDSDDYFFDHLDRLPLVAVARVGRVFDGFKPGQQVFLNWWLEGRGKAASTAGLWAYYALIPFGVYGAVLLHRRRITLVPVLSTVIVVAAAAAITFGITRYRVPVDVALVVLAGVGADGLLRKRNTRAGSQPSSQAPGGSS
jgi:4-amino-4-deoxy-L-arabinose transferase-like glycosyltransferase